MVWPRKLFVILLGGINALWFTLTEHQQIAGLTSDAPAPMLAKVMAGGSLAMWLLVILLGRLLPTFASTGGGSTSSTRSARSTQRSGGSKV